MDSTTAATALRAPSPRAIPSLRRSLLATCATTFALLALLATAGAQTASACVSPAFAPLALSTFEGADGDQCDSDGVGLLRDWQNIASDPDLTSTIDAPSNNDTMYGSNNAGIVGGPTAETVPDSWNFTTGNLGGGKFDALAASSFTDPENGKLFLDLGFVRATTSGDTFLAFELNQRQPGYRLDPNEDDPANPFAVPTRTAGDLLVTYHVGTGGANTLGLCVWDGDEHSGRWEEFTPDLTGAVITNQSCPMLSSDLYQAAINDGQGGRQGAIPGTENYLDPGTAISAGQFGEAVVNLTDALRDPINPAGPQPCVDFGYVWLHSRSSDSLTSNQQDFILPPGAVSIGNCSVEGSKFNDLDGDGARSVDEPFLGGWTIFVDYDGDGVLDNDMDDTFVNDYDGIVEAGEEEPFDVTADGTGTEPLGFYRITKIQPSNVGDPAGTWPIREILQPTWDCTAAVGGGAVAGCPEDTSTNPDSALGFRLAWTDSDEIYTGRDFGNKRQPPRLTVIKHVVNDNGGTQTAADFQVTVDDPGTNPPSFPGAESPGTDVTVDPGSYSVTEGAHDGYAVTYSADCAGTLAAGESKTCTITNDDIAPVLTVVKHVVNDNGGTQTADDFQITVDDPGTNPPSFPGAEAPGTDVTVDPGSYTVTEGAHDGYAVTYSTDCAGTLAIGQTKTCTVTNNDIAPTLTVIKNVINDNGGTKTAADFQITVDDPGTNPASFPGAGAPGTQVTVDPGDYLVTEGAHDGYAVTYSAECDDTLAIGETKTCTITNNDIAPVLTVIKHVINDDGGTQTADDFQITVDDPGTNPPSFPGAESPGTDVTVDPGAYTVSEGPHAGYAVSYSADCAGSLAIGQTKTCTITNDDIAPKLIVIKNVVNNNGGTKTAADFTLTVDDPGTNPPSFPGAGAPGTQVTVDPGDYVVTEGAHDGYAVTYSSECDDTLAIGETKTCTVTNDDIAATLTVIKHVINDDGGTKSADDFQITVDDPGTNPASFPGEESPGTLVAVDPGAYSVSEGDHAGYAVSYSAGCTGTAAIGATSTCTVTNDDIAPTLTVIKTVVNKNGSTATAADFTMHIDGSAGTETFPGAATPGTTKTLNAGSYDVTETGAATANYTASRSADCTGTLAVGDAKTCTITNTRKTGTITVVKDLIPSADSGRFDLRIDGSVVRANAGDGDGSGAVEVNTGTHTVSEVAGNAGVLADYVSSIACSNGASAAGSGPLDVAVTSGADITCTVTNTRKATVTVRKVTETADAATQFAFASGLPATAGPPAIAADGSFSLRDGTQVTTKVAPGAYPVSENDPKAQGYKLTGLSCTESATQNTTVATGDAIATARNATINAEAGETITCTFTNRKIVAQPIVVKAGDAIAYHGDVVSYSFSVTNTGNTPLHNVSVADDKCPNVSAAPTSKTNDDGDALLEPLGANGTTPEVWVYTCSYTMGAHQPGEANPVVNTATVSALDEFDRPVGDTDQHATTLLHQSIAIDKTGPATAQAGSLVTYELAVTNTGDVAFAGPLVILADARCEAPPVRVGVGGDTSPGSLDPGDVWRYTCSVQTAVGQTSVHNVASVDGTDTNGRKATDEDDATTALTQPAAPPPPAPTVGASEPVKPVALFPASARLRGANGCMPAVARFYVTGTRIAKVRFRVDGKHERFVSKKDAKGRYVYTLRRKLAAAGMHRVEARITFEPGSALKTKTLRATFEKCRREIRPTFTG